MYKRILLSMAITASFLSCDKEEDEGVEHFTSKVNVTNSMIEDDKYSMTLKFSTDGGTTFVDYPVVKIGQKYLVKIFNVHTESDVTKPNCYAIDWSASNPKPNGDAAADMAEFTMRTSNDIVATVTDYAEPFSAAKWVGTISGYENYGSAHWGPYDIELTQDPSNPNRFHLDNFYDSGLNAYIDFDPATGTVKFPNQTVGGKPITNSSGTYDQCRKQMVIELNYDGGDWTYEFGLH